MSIRDFYTQALRSSVASPTGRRVWLILAFKILVLLVLFKVLFFKDALADYTDAQKPEVVRNALVGLQADKEPAELMPLPENKAPRCLHVADMPQTRAKVVRNALVGL